MILIGAKNNKGLYDWALAKNFASGIEHECGYHFTKREIANVGKRHGITPEYISYEELYTKFGMIDEKTRENIS